MADLTDDQALRAARDLRSDFNDHRKMQDRRDVRSRDYEPPLEALGIIPELKDALPWQSEASQQETHQFATAIALPEPEVQVFAAESEKVKRLEAAEELELWYQAVVDRMFKDDYLAGVYMAGDGFAVKALSLDRRFFREGPKRGKSQDSESFNAQEDEWRRHHFPFSVKDIDPKAFYFEEDPERKHVTLGVEWLENVRESDVMPEGDRFRKGTLIVVRTPETIRQFWDSGQAVRAETIFEDENIFQHTGYFLYRGRQTGFPEAWRRYEPLIMVTLNQAQHRALLTTLMFNMGVRAATSWIEHDLTQGFSTAQERQVAVERKSKGRGAQVRTTGGQIAAEFEPGARIKSGELPTDLVREVLARMDVEEERYRFRDVLMGEAAADASGRAIIRMQEAAGRQLQPAYDARRDGILDALTVMRKTIYRDSRFLKGKRRLYIPKMTEGVGDEGNLRALQMASIGEEHDIPHEIRVKVASMSQAAQLAWMEEGAKMEGRLSRDTIDEEFYQLRDVPMENRRRLKDLIRGAVYPVAVQKGIREAIQALDQVPPPSEELIVPGQAPETGAATGGASPGTSGAATPPQLEDVGMELGGDGQGLMPAMEG